MKHWRVLFFSIMAVGLLCTGLGADDAWAQQASTAATSPDKLPADILPDSLARIPRAKRADMTTDEERQAFDRLVPPDRPPQTGPIGTVGLRSHFPIAAEKYRDAIQWIRANGGLEGKYAELAILVASREAVGAYEWGVHEPGALRAGLPQETIEIVRNQKEAKGLPEKEEIIIRFGREMVHAPKVSSKTFADAERVFGRKGTLAIALIVSHYAGGAMLVRAYDMRVAPDRKPPFPLP